MAEEVGGFGAVGGIELYERVPRGIPQVVVNREYHNALLLLLYYCQVVDCILIAFENCGRDPVSSLKARAARYS
jgi:hypothetical protein